MQDFAALPDNRGIITPSNDLGEAGADLDPVPQHRDGASNSIRTLLIIHNHVIQDVKQSMNIIAQVLFAQPADFSKFHDNSTVEKILRTF